jgi:phosphotransferase system IIB component
MSNYRMLVSICMLFLFMPTAHAFTEAEINAGKKQIQESFEGGQTLVIASLKTRVEVVAFSQAFLRKNKIDSKDFYFDVFESDNGWYAVTLGIETTQECKDRKLKLVAEGIISKESYCTDGSRFHGEYQLYGDHFEHIGGTAVGAD